jgi:hypothetical protein
MTTILNTVSDIRAPAPATNHQTRAGSSTSGVTSPKRLARIAGVLYLFLAIFGGFAQGFLEPKMYVAGDAVATAGNVLANAGLVRLGVVSELLGQTFFVFLASVSTCFSSTSTEAWPGQCSSSSHWRPASRA